MTAIAIIPARGGSKRLARKNIAEFRGRSILAYTIDAALEVGLFGRVVVSTEDEEIAAIAAHCGAEVRSRPAELATDTAGVIGVCIDVLDAERAAGRDWTTMVCLYATAPMRSAADIRATMALLQPGVCAFAMAVTSYAHPPHQALKLGADQSLEPMWPELVNRRASDLPALRVGNGSTYAVDVAEFRRLRTFYGPGLRGHDMPSSRSVDIDTAEDLSLARLLAECSNSVRP